MSHIKLVGYWFHILKIHIFLRISCVREFVERHEVVKDEAMAEMVDINNKDNGNGCSDKNIQEMKTYFI